MAVTTRDAISPARDAAVARILSAFDIVPGATVSGVAASGRFVPEPAGALSIPRPPPARCWRARSLRGADDYAGGGERPHAPPSSAGASSSASRGELVRLLGSASGSGRKISPAYSIENGQDPQRGARRDPGGHRHLRPRGRPVASALREDPAPSDRQHRLWRTGIRSGGRDHLAFISRGRPRWAGRSRWCAATRSSWKPSTLTGPLVAIACQQIFHDVTNGTEPRACFSLRERQRNDGRRADPHRRSRPAGAATGSCATGEARGRPR